MDIKELKEYAAVNNVPIMQDDGISFLTTFIKKNGITSILEIGSAIGYSAIVMASINDNITITTIERNQERYMEALKNIKRFNLEDRIEIIFKDALDVSINGKYDLIFRN